MTPHVLIFVAMIGGNSPSLTVSQQTYGTQAACQLAAEELMKATTAVAAGERIRVGVACSPLTVAPLAQAR